MAKTKEKEHKSRKKLSRTAKENWAIGIVALLILSVVVYECYTATHVRLQTYTAKETTVYRTIETTALAVREGAMRCRRPEDCQGRQGGSALSV